MTKQTSYQEGYRTGREFMRSFCLARIRAWITDSNFANKPDAVKVLQDLAGDISIAKVSK